MPYNFGFVDQGVNKMTKVKEYINAGMDTIIQVTQDMLDYDAGETLEPMASASKVDEMREMLKGFCAMERDVDAVLEAVQQVKQEVRGLDDDARPDLATTFDTKLQELQDQSNEPSFDSHQKVVDLNTRIKETIQQDGNMDPPQSIPAASMSTDPDVEVEMTQPVIVTKCPYTGKEMRNPVKNKHCKHSYDRDGIEQFIKSRGLRAKCPVPGCINQRPLEASHLEENREIKRLIERKKRGKKDKSGKK